MSWKAAFQPVRVGERTTFKQTYMHSALVYVALATSSTVEVCTWMDVVDHDGRRAVFPSGDGFTRSLDLEGPQVRFWVLAREIH